jgi:3-(3-hydroxy-phenyl)propionate hydroxylase
MMPPFAGQGLNSGLRDAVNLSWKIAEVLAGRASDRLLDTYEVERLPHAAAMIGLSVRLGRIVMTTSRRRALTRDVLVRAAMRTGPGRRYLSEMRYRPQTRLRDGALARTGDGRDEQLVGQILPQPRVLNGPGHELIRLDDVLGPGWSILGMDVTEADWVMAGEASLPDGTRVDVATGDRSARERGGRRAIADADGQLQATVNGLQHRFVLIRPDRVVAAVFPAGKAQQVAGKLAAAGIRDGEQDSDPAGHPDHRQPQTAVA